MRKLSVITATGTLAAILATAGPASAQTTFQQELLTQQTAKVRKVVSKPAVRQPTIIALERNRLRLQSSKTKTCRGKPKTTVWWVEYGPRKGQSVTRNCTKLAPKAKRSTASKKPLRFGSQMAATLRDTLAALKTRGVQKTGPAKQADWLLNVDRWITKWVTPDQAGFAVEGLSFRLPCAGRPAGDLYLLTWSYTGAINAMTCGKDIYTGIATTAIQPGDAEILASP